MRSSSYRDCLIGVWYRGHSRAKVATNWDVFGYGGGFSYITVRVVESVTLIIFRPLLGSDFSVSFFSLILFRSRVLGSSMFWVSYIWGLLFRTCVCK
jgi:hypothetical protein